MAVFFAYNFDVNPDGLTTNFRRQFPTQAAGGAIISTVGGVKCTNDLVDWKRTTDITTFPAANNDFVIICYRWRASAATLNQPMLRLRNGGTVQLQITANGTGAFDIAFNGSTQSTGNGSYAADTWYDVKVKFVCHASAGSVDFYLDNTEIYSVSGVDTANGSVDIENIWPGNNSVNQFIADIIMADDSGSIFNDIDFTKTYRVASILPNGAGNATDWTPSAGANYENVDEAELDTTNYNSSDTDTEKDTFALQDLGISFVDILGLQSWAVVDMDDATARQLNSVIRHSATEGASADRSIVNGQVRNVHGFFETNPSTGLAWTESEINAAEAGYELSK